MRIQAMMLAALMLGGCGTVQTVVRGDKEAADSLREEKTYCGAVPRIYSGVTYDFCMMHAELRDGVDAFDYNNANFGMLIDAAASGVLDTFLLPYTIYRQHADGSIVIN
ncbi:MULTISPECIES: YceK/YidQ family lipoprotein [unclassified Pseudomonas]|uniref:YceK/YidQ family lipoprotein n=1 Tax=unclassified Pseudomonas TaxID=196821 RepID=UPI001F585496|nr:MULTISPECIES: YceK/YidQ family lipoprotein [unclassified Pseudomonas]